MNYAQNLKDFYNQSFSVEDIKYSIPNEFQKYIHLIAEKSFEQKGVFTVLITLLVYKIFHPSQDIRYHKKELQDGFSGRTFDTKYITPTLKTLNLPSMAESGWLTRSLEQAYPYTLDYKGKIRDLEIKDAFLRIIDFIQTNKKSCESVLRLLLNKVINVAKNNSIEIQKLEDPDKLTINSIIECLCEHFQYNYSTSGGSKLPVLAFYAIYKSIITEFKRYENCKLDNLGFHTTSDLTSRSAGDIQIFDNDDNLFEAIEIKLDKEIDTHMVRIAYEKIIKFNPKRYCIFSILPLKASDVAEITDLVRNIKNKHGCQVILNGTIPTLKYYLRLINSLEKFIIDYSLLIENDQEIKAIHKTVWNNLISRLNDIR